MKAKLKNSLLAVVALLGSASAFEEKTSFHLYETEDQRQEQYYKPWKELAAADKQESKIPAEDLAKLFGIEPGQFLAEWHHHTNILPDGKKEEGGWVQNTAYVAPTAYIAPSCYVQGHAKVLDHARVELRSHVIGNSVVAGNARVAFDSTIEDNAQVRDNAWVLNGSNVKDNAQMDGHSLADNIAGIGDNAHLSDRSRVTGVGSGVYGYAHLRGDTWVHGGIYSSVNLPRDFVNKDITDDRYYNESIFLATPEGQKTMADLEAFEASYGITTYLKSDAVALQKAQKYMKHDANASRGVDAPKHTDAVSSAPSGNLTGVKTPSADRGH